ncbi:MAG: aromatic amino acid transport family protein [Candidatus Rickettsia vulgarisii]
MVFYIGLILILAVLILSLISLITWDNLPLVAISYKDMSSWYGIMVVIPLIFTSFGFQGSLHSIVSYCNKDIITLRKAIFCGCLIPAVVYVIWTVSTLAVISHKDQLFYQQMIEGKIEVGDLVKELSNITEWSSIQLFSMVDFIACNNYD